MEQITLNRPPPRPRFDDLPVDKDGPRGNIWGLFGKDDELGLLNYVTPDVTRKAAEEIRSGLRIPLDLPLDFFKVPTFNRKVFEHRIIREGLFVTLDDEISFNPQSTTQWDGFKHCAYQDHKLFYNGASLEDCEKTKRNGIHVTTNVGDDERVLLYLRNTEHTFAAWVKNGGIATRGVLVDFRRWVDSNTSAKASTGSSIDADAVRNADIKPAFERTPISAQDIRDVLTSQGTKLQPGDVLLVRSGYLAAYRIAFPSSLSPSALAEKLKEEQRDSQAAPFIGLEQSEDMLRLLWDAGVVAVASDTPALEAWPPPSNGHPFVLHEWLLAGWGCPIGEYFDLDRLAAECERAGRWSFFFSSMPLNVNGGVSSPVSGIAIL